MNARGGALSLALNLVGAVLVAWWLFGIARDDLAGWAATVAGIAVLAWGARAVCAFAGAPRTAVVLTALAVAAGALAAAPTEGTSVIPAAVCLLALVGDERCSPLAAVGATVAAIGVAAVGVVLAPVELPVVLTIFGVLVICCLGGLGRRQAQVAATQARLLHEQEVAAREESGRIAIARDLHDVLAHSLGGLVIQLDAVDALLEAGDAAAARSRVVSARDLAAAGLDEARRAVGALREPRTPSEAPVPPERLAAALAELMRTHVSLGGQASWQEAGRGATVSTATAAALTHALQEALSNARRHAPGTPVDAQLRWNDGQVRLTVRNPLVAGTVAGAGYGIVGMRERFAGLPAPGGVDAGAHDGMFTVTAYAEVPPASEGTRGEHEDG
ncbi:histidine kinase [Microbacterium horticulturae]|uniref:histidine kinase n=1 Tax=Microbacterium horticulturae TaxID=3028316 RepID=A0ABY8C3K0_9MICO|nr:histidine kinase [Microbacterium sp. KACC 23027]WEG09418.1 histidine kinase [Microbacterium sp. KACC 23027]